MLRFCFIPAVLLVALTTIAGCSNPSTPAKPGSGDTARHVFKITPDSSSVTAGANVTFTLTATPALPNPYTISWQIDNAGTINTVTNTFSTTFTTIGKHSISAIYTDSTGVKRDSARTIITVNDTSSLTTSGLGGFKIVVNHDTLDRSQFPTTCTATALYGPYTPQGYEFGIDLSFSRTQFDSPDRIDIGFTGVVPAPVAATYTIGPLTGGGQFYGLYDSTTTVVEYASLNGGTLTITKFDTANNLVSGSFRMPATIWSPKKDPNDNDTIVGSFSDVGITNRMFNQGAVSANIGGWLFQAVDSIGNNVEAALLPATGILTISARQNPGPNVGIIILSINTPKVDSFAFGDGSTPGTAKCSCYFSNIFTSTQGYTNCGSLKITAFDPVSRRLSGSFTATCSDGKGTTVTVTNGVLDNVMWVQE